MRDTTSSRFAQPAAERSSTIRSFVYRIDAMAQSSVPRIDKFDVLRRLGRGGMGSVYLARDPDMDRLVAIKLLNEGFDEEELRGRFASEARSASALRHTNIVTIFQTGTFLERPFIVMEYVAGETFADIIASGRSVPIAEQLQLLDQLLAGLQYAHAKGIVHRDIKPSNVMVDGEGVVRILDFGIARLGDGGLTRTGAVLGTLNYMAPEQLAGQVVDIRADIFAAGLVSYELLSSKPAFPQAFPEILRHIAFMDPPPLEELRPGIDQGLVRLVGRCLAKQAGDRYPDCAAVRRDLDAVRRVTAGGVIVDAPQTFAPTPAAPPTPTGPPKTPSSPALPERLSDTLKIGDAPRRPTDRSAPPVEDAEPELVRTIVIPRPPTSPGETPASAPSTPASGRHIPVRPRTHLIAYAGAALVIVAIAAGMWKMMRAPGEGSAALNVTEAPAANSPSTSAAPVALPTTPGNDAGNRLPVEPANPSPAPVPSAPRRTEPASGRGAATRGASPPAPVRVGGAVKPPKLIKRVNPEYPSMALSARLQGVVILEARIGTDGKVRDVRVLRSIALLDNAAAAAVRQWEYEPTILNGVAVPVITSVAVEFKLTPPAPVRVGGAVTPPAQTKRVNPPYPPEAQAAGVQGVVIMEATIGADGKVSDVRVLRSIPLLDQAAMDAVRQWEYAPTVLNGTPVPVLMTVTLNFTLTPPAQQAAPVPAK
jgi:TonB family protein